MMKKVGSLVLILMCVLGSVCFARGNPNATLLPRERMALGGLHVGDTMEYVRSIYGEPDDEKSGYSRASDNEYAAWKYGDSVKIHFTKYESDGMFHIQAINVTADNGFATPDGVKVGTSVQELKKIYGVASFQPKAKTDGMYRYCNDKSKFIHFVFTVKNGKISYIGLGYND